MRETVQLSQGDLQVRIEGNGPAIVFVHGALVNGELWKGAVERLRSQFRCVVVEMPLGSHTLPLPAGADRTPHGQAARVAELLEKLGLDDVTLVGNDSGGAICQLVAATAPARIGRLVLTNCDAFEVFPPAEFAWLKTISSYPRVMAALSHVLARVPTLARLPTAYGRLSRRRIPGDLLAAWTGPGVDPAVRTDIAGFFGAAGPEVLVREVPALRRFERPVLLVWGTSDPFFALSLAERLVATFPQATLQPVHDCGTFVPLDAPEALVTAIEGFVGGRRVLRAVSA